MKNLKYSAFIASAISIIASSVCTACGGGNDSQSRTAEHGHSHGEKSEIALTETQLHTVDIKLGHIERKELSNTIHANGTLSVNPQDAADVSPLVSGIISGITVVEGNQVREGQTLAYIEASEIIDLQQNYLEASDELTLAQTEYDRQKALSAQGAGVQKNLQAAQSTYGVAKAKAEGIRARLELAGINPADVKSGKIAKRAPLSAPISGTVSRIGVNIGGYADMQTPVMTIVDNNAVYCRLSIFEKDIAMVKPGQKVDIRLTNVGSTHLTGEVEEINRSIDTDSKAFAVRVRLSDGVENSLVPGMAVTALISTGHERVDALPDDAVVNSAGKSYIFVVEDIHDENADKVYHFRKTEVATGLTEMGYIQIYPFTPIADSTLVVTSNAFYIASMAADHGEHSH
ncbi:MAG: efflux RND transporter periplasmic adaptor subunit [Muribaculum sp.]|nr:efflux RND transporter periplasmic adaptor subunit [Muribaculum sp.]